MFRSEGSSRFGRALLLCSLLLAAGLAVAQCELPGTPVSLRIEGLGTAYFQEFTTDPLSDSVRIGGGICIEGEGGEWSVTALSAVITGLRTPDALQVRLEEPILFIGGWRVESALLETNGSSLRLDEATIVGAGLTGSASRLEVEVGENTLRPVGTDLEVEGRSFRARAASWRLEQDVIVMEDLVLTTCVCSSAPFYTLSGDSGRLDLEQQSLTLRKGAVRIAGLRLGLRETVVLDEGTFENLRLPLSIEYRPAGTGLALLVPRLQLEPGLDLEAGLLGIGGNSPLQAYALAHISSPQLAAVLGRTRGGPRADVTYRQGLAEGTELSFEVRNRHEPDSDFLHEGGMRLRALPREVALGGGFAVDLSAEAFGFASVQALPAATVASPRLGAAASVKLRGPLAPGMTVQLGVGAQSTAYPHYGAIQYGLSLEPAWSYRSGPWSLLLGYQRTWTNSASPFSGRLDRLSPRERANARVEVAGSLWGTARGRADLEASYDLLRLGGEPGGLDRLGLGIGVSYPQGEWTVALDGRLELAGLLDPDPAGRREGYFQTGVSGRKGHWEAGALVRYGLRPDARGLSLVELRGATPLRFEQGVAVPFLALDFSPLIQRGEAPRISGHGLELTWESCCGTFKVGYRQYGDRFTTSFGVALEY